MLANSSIHKPKLYCNCRSVQYIAPGSQFIVGYGNVTLAGLEIDDEKVENTSIFNN